MRSKTVKTAFGIAILSVMALFGLSLSAYAFSGEMSGTALLFTYYDVRPSSTTTESGFDLTDNYFVVTNNSTNWVQAHVRVRTGKSSVELLDFDILMSPRDQFNFDLFQNDGKLTFASCDTKTLLDSGFDLNYARDGVNFDCVVLDNTSFPKMTSLIMTCEGVDADTAVLEAMKGYVEVIGEGVIVPCSKDTCAAADGSCSVSIPGKTLLNSDPTKSLATSPFYPTENIIGLCPASVFPMNYLQTATGELEGRLYYARVSVSDGIINGVSKMATLNGEVLDDALPNGPILHLERYDLEQASPRCGSQNGGPDQTSCYAYVAASTTTPVDGADDLNYCFYTDKIDSTGVFNKYGAAATFGPTLVDLVVARTGAYALDQAALQLLTIDMSQGYSTFDAGANGSAVKAYADTHYFAVPAPKYEVDMNSGFSFTFPLQHFIGEKDHYSNILIYDFDERTTTIGKFFSPGLPEITNADETSLQFLTANFPFVEGWLRFAVSASNGTGSCTTAGGTATAADCTVLGFSPAGLFGATTYVPAYTAASFVNGATELTATHFQYNGPLTGVVGVTSP
jgi:hypothetical protein